MNVRNLIRTAILAIAFFAVFLGLNTSDAWAQQPADPPPHPAQPSLGPRPRVHRPRFVEPAGTANQQGMAPGARPVPPPPPTTTTSETPAESKDGKPESTEEEHGPKPFNLADFSDKETPPYVALLINTAILFAIYFFMGKKQVTEGLKSRKASVAKEIDEANRMLKEAEGRAKIYQAKLANLEQDLETTKKALEEAGKGERDKIVREANEKAERMQRDAQFLIEQEVRQLRQDLTREAVEIAVAAAETVLKQTVTDADHQRIADDLLTGLAKNAPKRAGVGA